MFALAPLSRAAERLAERAVPVALPVPRWGTTAEGTFRSAVARLLHDGALSREAVEEELAARRDAARVEVGE